MVRRWVVLGAGGMLGRDLIPLLREVTPRATVLCPTRLELELSDTPALETRLQGLLAPEDVVVNLAAWTDVDGAEANEALALTTNGLAVARLSRACAAVKAHLLHVSTDYVFSGEAQTPYAEDSPTGPLNAYGRTKRAGEEAVLALHPRHGYIVRTAWLYALHGKNFVTTVRRMAQDNPNLRVVEDQRGQPTWTGALAAQLCALGQAAFEGRAPPGIYHGTSTGETTWFGFARALFEASGWDPTRVLPTTSDAYLRPARRPRYSVLGHARWAPAGIALQPPWRDQLQSALAMLPR
jgi:dTDP-4-dehydrorhamnose reductase